MAAIECLWETPPKDLALTDGHAHIWCAPLDLPASNIRELTQILSPDEQEKANRFHFELDRKRFIAAHGALRAILARYLATASSQLQFSYGSRGKPALLHPNTDKEVCFNMSHSNGQALFAVAWNRAIGIDIEFIRDLPDLEQLARYVFCPADLVIFSSLSTGLKKELFFHGWALKEALLKATGEGLSEMEQVEVMLTDKVPGKGPCVRLNEYNSNRWMVKRLNPTKDYTATLVMERQACDVDLPTIYMYEFSYQNFHNSLS